MTFSVLHAWITYFMVYNFFQSFKAFLGTNNGTMPWLELVSIEVMAEVVFTLMLVEMCLYLAYFKDVIFSLVTLINYIGMYIY